MRVVYRLALWDTNEEHPNDGEIQHTVPGVDKHKSGEDVSYRVFRTQLQGFEMFNEWMEYADFTGQYTMFRAATKDDPLNPDLAAAGKQGTFQLFLGTKCSKYEAKVRQELQRRFNVELGEAVAKVGQKMADFLAVAKSGSGRGVVKEVSIGSKNINEIREQLENGIRYLIEKEGVNPNSITVYFRTNNRKLGAKVRKELQTVLDRDVHVIID